MAMQTVQSAMTAFKSSRGGLVPKYFPTNIGSHGILMVFNKYQFERPGSRGLLVDPGSTTALSKTTVGAVMLPIPATLTDSNHMKLTAFDMGTSLGGEAVASAASKGSALGAAGAVWDETAKIASSLMNLNITAKDALFAIRKMEGEGPITNAAAHGLGATLNPKTSLIFDGMDLRSYTFDWSLTPMQEPDSFAIQDIIKLLKQNVLPTYSDVGTFTRGMINYPSTVDLYLIGVDPTHFMKFKTAMINDMAVNYTPNGLSILRGGRPASVNLSLSFLEMDIHTANDYDATVDQYTFDQFVRDGMAAVSNVIGK